MFRYNIYGGAPMTFNPRAVTFVTREELLEYANHTYYRFFF
jgi:hypothetical protein